MVTSEGWNWKLLIFTCTVLAVDIPVRNIMANIRIIRHTSFMAPSLIFYRQYDKFKLSMARKFFSTLFQVSG
jgi:hypothetical protein